MNNIGYCGNIKEGVILSFLRQQAGKESTYLLNSL
jgi:hypothetical protein